MLGCPVLKVQLKRETTERSKTHLPLELKALRFRFVGAI